MSIITPPQYAKYTIIDTLENIAFHKNTHFLSYV
jgi:hypothetical protein